MKRAQHRGLSFDFDVEGVLGLHDVHTLDDLIRVHYELAHTERISCKLVIRVLERELASHEFISLLSDLSSKVFEQLKLHDIASPLQKIPRKLYFFLWHLRNSDTLPLEGMLTSMQLRKAVYQLAKFLMLLELFVKRAPNSLPVYESLGLTHIDLAGVAGFSRSGLLINGKQLHHTYLLRKAVTCFQLAIKLEACHAKEFDASHEDVMKLLDEDFGFKENRMSLYLNPWYFLYIASALQLLNDHESFTLYLDKARLILNCLSDHQNPRVRAQRNLLESVFSSMKYGGAVHFELDRTKLMRLRQRLKRIKKNKKSVNGRTGYSPFVEEILAEQYRTQRSFLKHGSLNPEQMEYLQGIFTLYNEVRSPFERDKLIFRLNIPPLRAKGFQANLHQLQPASPRDAALPQRRQLNSA